VCNPTSRFGFFLMMTMFSLAVFAAAQPKIVIDSPTDGQSVQSVAIIKFHTENVNIQSPFGARADNGGPRNIGHLHVTVDDNSWYWVHSTNDPVVIAGLSPGVHRVTLDLAGPDHKPIASQSVTFKIGDGIDEDARLPLDLPHHLRQGTWKTVRFASHPAQLDITMLH
jgi:hypothetical protein